MLNIFTFYYINQSLIDAYFEAIFDFFLAILLIYWDTKENTKNHEKSLVFAILKCSKNRQILVGIHAK